MRILKVYLYLRMNLLKHVHSSLFSVYRMCMFSMAFQNPAFNGTHPHEMVTACMKMTLQYISGVKYYLWMTILGILIKPMSY
jgi:hypothetical protein